MLVKSGLIDDISRLAASLLSVETARPSASQRRKLTIMLHIIFVERSLSSLVSDRQQRKTFQLNNGRSNVGHGLVGVWIITFDRMLRIQSLAATQRMLITVSLLHFPAYYISRVHLCHLLCSFSYNLLSTVLPQKLFFTVYCLFCYFKYAIYGVNMLFEKI